MQIDEDTTTLSVDLAILAKEFVVGQYDLGIIKSECNHNLVAPRTCGTCSSTTCSNG